MLKHHSTREMNMLIFIDVYVYAYVNGYVYAYVNVYVNAYVYTCIYVCIYKYICIYVINTPVYTFLVEPIQPNMWFSYFSIFSIPQQYGGSWGYVPLGFFFVKKLKV